MLRPLFNSPPALPSLMPSSISSISSGASLAGNTYSSRGTSTNRQSHRSASASALLVFAHNHLFKQAAGSHAASDRCANSHDQKVSDIHRKVWPHTAKAVQPGAQIAALGSSLIGTQRNSLSGGMANSIAVADTQNESQLHGTDAMVNSRAKICTQVGRLCGPSENLVNSGADSHMQTGSKSAMTDNPADTSVGLELLAAAGCCAKAVTGVGTVYVLPDVEPLCHTGYGSIFRSAVFASCCISTLFARS